MPIKFRCPHCEQFLGISRAKAGAVTDCPTCGHTIRIPAEDGTVKPLPAPRLDLQDDQLRAALGALAEVGEVGEVRSNPSLAPSVLKPQPIDKPPEVIELEIVSPRHTGPIVVAELIPQKEDVTVEQDLNEDPLAELARSAPDLPDVAPEVRKGIQFGPGILLATVFASALCGLVIGLIVHRAPHSKAVMAPQPDEQKRVEISLPPAEIPEKQFPQVRGSVTYPGPAGVEKPDRGARVLLLPLKRSGTAKLPNQGFRVGAEEIDRQLLAASVTVLGGNFELADSQGRFLTAAPNPGRYGLLVASRYQPRPESISISANCQSFLNEYFERPELVIGNVEYEFFELELESPEVQERNVQFAVR